jgi:hypothetical protein
MRQRRKFGCFRLFTTFSSFGQCVRPNPRCLRELITSCDELARLPEVTVCDLKKEAMFSASFQWATDGKPDLQLSARQGRRAVPEI